MKTQKSLRLEIDDQLITELDNLADAKGVTRSKFIRNIFMDYLSREKKIEEQLRELDDKKVFEIQTPETNIPVMNTERLIAHAQAALLETAERAIEREMPQMISQVKLAMQFQIQKLIAAETALYRKEFIEARNSELMRFFTDHQGSLPSVNFAKIMNHSLSAANAKAFQSLHLALEKSEKSLEELQQTAPDFAAFCLRLNMTLEHMITANAAPMKLVWSIYEFQQIHDVEVTFYPGSRTGYGTFFTLKKDGKELAKLRWMKDFLNLQHQYPEFKEDILTISESYKFLKRTIPNIKRSNSGGVL